MKNVNIDFISKVYSINFSQGSTTMQSIRITGVLYGITIFGVHGKLQQALPPTPKIYLNFVLYSWVREWHLSGWLSAHLSEHLSEHLSGCIVVATVGVSVKTSLGTSDGQGICWDVYWTICRGIYWFKLLNVSSNL